MVTRKIIGALLVSTSAAALPVQAQICQTTGAVISLGFEVKPSLVAHSEPSWTQRSMMPGLEPGGDPTERLFSFKHTIGAILESAEAPNTPASREAFVQTMLDTFSPTATAARSIGRQGCWCRSTAAPGKRLGLNAAGLLDETDTSATSIACARWRCSTASIWRLQLEPLRRAPDRLWQDKPESLELRRTASS